jgi:hypothetical protein
MLRAIKRIPVVVVLALSTVASGQETSDGHVPEGIRAIEWAVETSTRFTKLPTNVPALVNAKQCEQCTGLQLSVTRQTRFLLNKTQISLEELRNAASEEHPMGVFYDPTSKNVTRIIIFNVSAGAKQLSR